MAREITLREHLQSISSAGGKARQDSLSQKEREFLESSMPAMGGKARAKKLSPRKRKEIAKKAAAARWGKKNGGN